MVELGTLDSGVWFRTHLLAAGLVTHLPELQKVTFSISLCGLRLKTFGALGGNVWRGQKCVSCGVWVTGETRRAKALAYGLIFSLFLPASSA